ncbi:MAG TPA: DeoR/GlpR transcriptional regulator [Lachnospiraceae bacterium]|nr:DeoR/GlpR transcriptional regulator [Lachnospiraceae bacterium]
MLAAERRSRILEKLYEERSVVVSELSREFEVSEETIRRDLEKLSDDGQVVKSYGGAVLNDKMSIDLPFNVRQKENPGGKQKIAELVCKEIGDGDHILLDASTTSVFIARNLKQKKRMTIITNSIENLLELSEASDINVISTGGVFNPATMSLLGRRTAEVIRLYNVDKVFMSCKAIDKEKGIMDGNDDISSIKQEMIASASRVYLAVDSSKFSKLALSRICPLSSVDVLITDKKPSEEWMRAFKENNIECIYAE